MQAGRSVARQALGIHGEHLCKEIVGKEICARRFVQGDLVRRLCKEICAAVCKYLHYLLSYIRLGTIMHPTT